VGHTKTETNASKSNQKQTLIIHLKIFRQTSGGYLLFHVSWAVGKIITGIIIQLQPDIAALSSSSATCV